MTLTNGGSNGNLSWKNSQLHWYVSTSNPLVKKLRLLLDKCSCIKFPKATVHLERPWRKGTSKTGQLEYFVAKQFLYFKYIVAYKPWPAYWKWYCTQKRVSGEGKLWPMSFVKDVFTKFYLLFFPCPAM